MGPAESLACTNSLSANRRVPIVVAGIIFLVIFVVNAMLLVYYWSKYSSHKRRKIRRIVNPNTPTWLPFVLVGMIGLIVTALYVIYYIHCDVAAAILTLLLPLIGAVAVAAKWPSYSLNPLVFGYEVAYETRNNGQ